MNGQTLTNNSGDVVVPCNKWDAGQLYAWGVKGTSFTGAGAPARPSSITATAAATRRGVSPPASAGPQSGYAWNFNWNEWVSSGKDAAAMRAAMGTDEIGPWKRIQYDGDRISYDQPGLISTVLGYASKDAGNLGVPVSALPLTSSQTDATSPKAIRWAVGQLTAFRPEYAWVKVRVDNAAGISDPVTGCPDLRGDTFGGDAGGTDNGKDHLWRYYEPTEVKMNLCVVPGKPAGDQFVKSGDLLQYPIKVYNLQTTALTNVVVKDTLGAGLTFRAPSRRRTAAPTRWCGTWARCSPARSSRRCSPSRPLPPATSTTA